MWPSHVSGVRALSRLCSKRSQQQPFNVINRTGGSGVVSHSAIATAAPDGYTLGIITVEISMMHWQGLTELKPNSCTPLALMNEDPPGVARPFLNFACASSTTSLADASPR